MIASTTSTVSLCVSEASQIGEARRLATAMAGTLGFSATEAGKVSIVVTEVASNLIKHATRGEILLRGIERNSITGLEILSLDTGPGMADIDRCLRDGYSTAGSPGTGMGAMARQSSEFDIYSRPGVGTVILLRLWATPPLVASSPCPLQVGGVSVPVDGEHLCGDGWAVVQSPERTVILLADGLGHGQFACGAAEEAVRIFRANAGNSPAEILQYAHGALRSTRGAAVAVAEISGEVVRFAGIGNIAAAVLSGGTVRNMISHNGIVGHEMRRVHELTYPWPADGLLVMNSDGLQTRWTLDNYPGVHRHDPALVAGVLYRDFKRDRDDVTVVACRSRTP